MKKILLSLAVIAASGAYVAYEGPFGATAGIAATASADTPPPAVKPASAILPAPSGAVETAAAPSGPAPESITPAAAPALSALRSPVAPLPDPVQSEDHVSADQTTAELSIVPETPVTPPVPLPRPRPAYAPTAVVQAAQTLSAQAAYRNGTFKGPLTDAYYGRVQVAAVIKGGQLVAVDVLSYPNDRRTSRNINGRALPRLEQEAIQAQSANIDGVSGATLTSGAYEQSLDAALSAARPGGSNA